MDGDLGVIRLGTWPEIFPRPLSVEDAFRVVEQWLGHRRAQVVNPGERHAGILAQLVESAGTAGNLTMDAHLAALAIGYGATVLTFDRDFACFEGVRWLLPSAN